jgi:uncharacterized membrane protein
MRRFANYFLRGLVITAPAALTFYICWVAIRWLDGLLGTSIPGLGIAAAVVIITMIGALASNFVTRAFVSTVDQALARLPFVRLVYTSIKDLLGAFVGEQRRFNRPVKVRLGEPDAAIHVLGFVTSDSLTQLGFEGHVAVYVPTSYSFAGHLIVVPADRVTALGTDAADTLAFIVSGGVTRAAEGARRPGGRPIA